MLIELKGITLDKVATGYEANELADDQVVSVTKITIKVQELDPLRVRQLARYAAYGLPIHVNFESPQSEMDLGSAAEQIRKWDADLKAEGQSVTLTGAGRSSTLGAER